MPPDISVCICTFRRPAGLARTLSSMVAASLPGGLSVEVLIVDNDAAGSAREVAERHALGQRWPLRYVVEAHAGVGHARNRCLADAGGEWLAFVDDDELVREGWLVALWAAANASPVDAVFGPVEALVEGPLPAWQEGSGLFARHHQRDDEPLDWRRCASGNVLLHVARARSVGGFDTAFARTGAEDTDFFRRWRAAGGRFAWCEGAAIDEVIPPERISRRWARRRAFLGGQNYARLVRRHDGPLALANVWVRGLVGLICFAPLALAGVCSAAPWGLRAQVRLAGAVGKFVGPFYAVKAYGKG